MTPRFLAFALLVCLLTGMIVAQNPAQDMHHEHASPVTGNENAPKVFFPMADQPEMEMHHHGEIPEVMPQLPHLGKSQRVVTGPVYQLKDMERMAAEHNPALAQAQRAV